MIQNQVTTQTVANGLMTTGGASGVAIWITEYSSLIGLCFTGATCAIGIVLGILNYRLKRRKTLKEIEIMDRNKG